jgi:peptide/nickel transport system permease protein
MGAYIVRRLLLIVPTGLLVTLICFGTVRFIPGSVMELMAAEMSFDIGLSYEDTVDYVREQLGMDEPIYLQYGRWLGIVPREDGSLNGVLQGSLGNSLWLKTPILDELLLRLPVSFELGLLAIIIGILLAIPIGTYSAIRQDTIGDYLGRSVAILGLSIPHFLLGTMIIVFPSIWWGWTPDVQYIPFFEDPLENLEQFIIPALVMGGTYSASIMRLTRSMMLEVLRQDYIRTAWSKGLTEKTVVLRHAMRGAIIPVITQIGMQLPVLFAGAVVTEQIFNLPGIGVLMISSISNRDYAIISGINLLIATFILFINLAVDMTYSWLDPRVRYK